ncbi:unnamed protein product [Cyclocybe aegerita]|uniref:G domain-containing protein n=1 Tax=Cyclocybe aegerita TaxID=1973307 RepID=A0A8S0VTT7_CYCAE|nr:unnamed protein product [Cyclocybe aegerita]
MPDWRKLINWKSVHETDIKNDDIVILLIGQTGTGKSTFINTATQRNLLAVHKLLKPCTTAVAHVRCNFPGSDDGGDARGVVFVDTPPIGADDLKGQERAEKLIYKWKEDVLDKRRIKLAGILYLYRISDNRMPDPPLPQYRKFSEIFKTDVPILLVTTMWERPPEDDALKEGRQKVIASSWQGLGPGLKRKRTQADLQYAGPDAPVTKHDGTHDSAWRVVDELLARRLSKPNALS